MGRTLRVLACLLFAFVFVSVAAASEAPSRTSPDLDGTKTIAFASRPIVTATCGITCAQADLDGSASVGPADLSKWLAKFFANTYDVAYDFDHNGQLTPSDLAIWVCEYWSCN
jgi:hypothetical protein